MDRVFKSGASATPPSPPSSPSVGYPIGGDPGLGTPATKPGPYWYHMITEELRGLVAAAGLTPDASNLNQLTLAVQELIRQAAGDYKASVHVATTANITALNGGAPNTLDGVTLVLGDRILVKDQTTASQNGIYVVTTLGTGANGTWSRAGDADTALEINSGAMVVVEEGTTNADSQWVLTTNAPITLGTTSLTFAKQGGGGSLVNVVRYASAGSGTYNKPSNVTKIRVRVVGGGGGGAAGYGDYGAGGGGGAGGYCETFITSPATSYAYTVGAAGAAGATTAGGGNGGSTTIAGMTASGGVGGQTGTGSGGTGGSASGGQLNVPGGGGGGGSPRAGSYADGGGGNGGASAFGGGGAGGGRVNAQGTAGSFGGGGGGSGALGTSAGAAGGAGFIEIEEYA